MVPVGEALTGSRTDFLGRLNPEGQQLGSDAQLPLFNEQASMDDREQIQEPLFTGLKVFCSSDWALEALPYENLKRYALTEKPNPLCQSCRVCLLSAL